MMKKLNNHGFAATTVLYSISIMAFMIVSILMSIMSVNRKNSHELVDTIESELNRFGMTKTSINASSDDAQEYIVPISGWYKIELWGASGGQTSTAAGGNGGYTSGVIYLEASSVLDFNIGKAGENAQSIDNTSDGGHGGGGSAPKAYGAGGGATDARIAQYGTLVYFNSDDIDTRIMVAGGGGGAAKNAPGGAGGGIIGGSGKTDGTASSSFTTANGGTQSATTKEKGNDASTGGAGGGGYYGGAAGQTKNSVTGSGAGGSSYILGYAGCSENTLVNNSTNNLHMHFLNGFMAQGVNYGNGKAKIELVSTDAELPIKNEMLETVKCVKVKGALANNSSVQGVKNASNISFGTGTYDESNKTKTFTLSSVNQLDDLSIFYIKSNETETKNNITSIKEVVSNPDLSISISSDCTNYSSVVNNQKYNVTLQGIHITPYNQYQELGKELSTGIYHIFSANMPFEKSLTAVNSNDQNSPIKNAASITFNASNLQKWGITKLGDGTYKIVERESNGVLQTAETPASNNTNVNTNSSFNNNDWAKWKIESMGDGTYRLSSSITPNTFLTTALETTNDSNVVMQLDNATSLGQRWIIINAEY